MDSGSLLRSTLEEFNNFVLTLDKLLSDNIDREFFAGDVPYESEIERRDGKIIVQQKNPLRILNEWITNVFGNPGTLTIGRQPIRPCAIYGSVATSLPMYWVKTYSINNTSRISEF